MPPRPATVLCVAGFKGGIGKTTSAVNMSACLAGIGHRVLLCDCDPQANASEMFFSEEEIEHDLRSVIADRVPVQKVIRLTRVEGLWVLPASFDLAYLDKELVVSPAGVQRIERAVRPVISEYDYLVFDTGPNLSHLTLGALAASQHIIIPVSAAVWSITSLRKFIGWIDQNRRDEVLAAELLGLLPTMVAASTRIGRDAVAEVRQSGYPSFEAVIPKRTAAEDAVADRVVAIDRRMDKPLREAYQAFTREVADAAGPARGGAHRAIAR